MTTATVTETTTGAVDGARRPAGWAAVTGGLASIVGGAVQAVRVDDLNPIVDRSEHVLLTAVAVALVLWIPAYVVLGRMTGTRAGRIGGLLAALGCALLAVGMTSTNLHDQDYPWFGIVAVPANAAWLAGSVTLAVVAFRRRTLPRGLAAALGLVWVTSIILSQAGGNLVAGLIWAVAGWLMIAGARSTAA